MKPKAFTSSSGVVEILGPWLLNKGDDLMLQAVCEALRPSYRVAASSNLGLGQFPDRRHLYRVLAVPGDTPPGSLGARIRRVRRTLAVRYLPEHVLGWLGVVPGEHVTALLDCSGFAYGDQWSTNRLRHREILYRSLKQTGRCIVMLPQALGPFESEEVRCSAKSLFQHFDFMFVRDAESHQHLIGLGVPECRVETVPDVTHLLDGAPPASPDLWTGRACVVPNSRMLDKTSADVSAEYFDFLLFSIRELRSAGMDPFLMLHETNDAQLAASIVHALDTPIQIVDEDAVVSKGILGTCAFVLSSRYHALISALSQGTPVLGTSWTHKYEAVFREYDCRENLVSPLDDRALIRSRISDLAKPSSRRALSETLTEAASRQKERVRAMWSKIDILLRGVGPSVG